MAEHPADALGCIRLLVQINDWSLRGIGAREFKTGCRDGALSSRSMPARPQRTMWPTCVGFSRRPLSSPTRLFEMPVVRHHG